LPFVVRELELLDQVKVIVVLGAFAYEAAWRVLGAVGVDLPRPRPKFGHGLEVATARATILGCFHPSQQNTFTGRLTEPMLDAIMSRACALSGST
jgi:uracil-DNA glycosylase